MEEDIELMNKAIEKIYELNRLLDDLAKRNVQVNIKIEEYRMTGNPISYHFIFADYFKDLRWINK